MLKISGLFWNILIDLVFLYYMGMKDTYITQETGFKSDYDKLLYIGYVMLKVIFYTFIVIGA